MTPHTAGCPSILPNDGQCIQLEDIQATVSTNTRLTHESHFQQIHHMEFDVHKADYAPADVLLVRPKNPEYLVDTLLDCLGWTEDACKFVTIHRDGNQESLSEALFTFYLQFVDFMSILLCRSGTHHILFTICGYHLFHTTIPII
jgi:sulfite reductase alpha subunit-like flavoprotein